MSVCEEYQVVAPDTGELSSYVTELLEDGETRLENVHPELHTSTLEVASDRTQVLPKHGLGELSTDRKLDIMNILWDRGSATVRETKEEMEADLAYTSVLTVFQTLEKNGHVKHEKDGKAYRYEPTVSREEAGAALSVHVVAYPGSRPPPRGVTGVAIRER